ncbi:uncharacterized protein LOC118613806 [Rousettus aegyptiacus]|uniref:uncharacterized protein LOC118613806 n=1 Tax=Rousettus aegyptiacus TaxID=9407 RepID=UPI00168D4A73|nr:uncharacterized protein LOC118613806 [Rousettus aegyptiacus]
MRRVWGAVPRILLVRRRRSCSCRRASLRRPTAEFAPAASPFPEGSCGAQGCALPRAVPGQWPVHAGVQRAGPLSSIQENSEGPPRLLSSRCKWLRLPAAPQHDVGPVQLARSPAASRERSLPGGLRACTSRRLGFCFPGNPARDRSLTVQVKRPRRPRWRLERSPGWMEAARTPRGPHASSGQDSVRAALSPLRRQKPSILRCHWLCIRISADPVHSVPLLRRAAGWSHLTSRWRYCRSRALFRVPQRLRPSRSARASSRGIASAPRCLSELLC